MEISVRQTSIKPKFIKCLISNGIVLVSHLNKFDTPRLVQKTKINPDDCDKILAAIKPKRPHYIMRASELLVQPFARISTLIEELDKVLGGGIKCGQITEISGEASAGKSNMCSEIGTRVMLPKTQDGLDGDVLLIHTEGQGKLKLACKRFNTLAASVGENSSISSKLHVMNCCNEFELVEIINRLPDTLEKKPTVKLIIIDSITCAFITTDGKVDYEFYAKRSLTLTRIVKKLAHIAWDKRLAVIATNHVSYNFKWGQNKPAMGKTWSHMCQTKIYLERKGNARFAHVTKGAVTAPTPIRFTITNDLYSIASEKIQS